MSLPESVSTVEKLSFVYFMSHILHILTFLAWQRHVILMISKKPCRQIKKKRPHRNGTSHERLSTEVTTNGITKEFVRISFVKFTITWRIWWMFESWKLQVVLMCKRTNKMHKFLQIICIFPMFLFAVHVSDELHVHHQEHCLVNCITQLVHSCGRV